MTNFEWLFSNDILRSFVMGLHSEKYDDFITHWGIPRTSPSFSESISKWLIQEYQKPKAKDYVLLEDVVSLLNEWLSADDREAHNKSIDLEPTLRENLKVREIDE